MVHSVKEGDSGNTRVSQRHSLSLSNSRHLGPVEENPKLKLGLREVKLSSSTHHMYRSRLSPGRFSGEYQDRWNADLQEQIVSLIAESHTPGAVMDAAWMDFGLESSTPASMSSKLVSDITQVQSDVYKLKETIQKQQRTTDPVVSTQYKTVLHNVQELDAATQQLVSHNNKKSLHLNDSKPSSSKMTFRDIEDNKFKSSNEKKESQRAFSNLHNSSPEKKKPSQLNRYGTLWYIPPNQWNQLEKDREGYEAKQSGHLLDNRPQSASPRSKMERESAKPAVPSTKKMLREYRVMQQHKNHNTRPLSAPLPRRSSDHALPSSSHETLDAD
ncbi:hypothetical protein PROFUN_00210 [Planoprotostelium fungivorum]|uniref:Uncharacterized protein n=1 Tax=Planoprotostelium fungivorum TaxID=1890364 RepID=A0A2P6P0Z6_9EUKA|nr:hypothetical protein PROFUN_00210 [Planoprotostelium fungivorum]